MIKRFVTPYLMQIMGGALIAAGLAIAGLSAYVWGVPIIGGGLLDKLETRTAERDSARTRLAELVRESDRRKATGKRTLEADKPKSEQRTKAMDAVQLRDGECETDPEIISAVEKGWVR